ncbi:MarR family winged helix-turn-helix transcriptional regulator [Umezawaea tangerina]|uniref:MarR family winged helix-turn-helix transcriptional regulator n=1 Tax=Umezawaea tangerina TaxID=84725 RepID=UPI000D073D3B|nr:MarR family transcriptional regulator [Umezawaea tangerina]
MDTDETAGGLGELFLRQARRIRRAYGERLAPLGFTLAQSRALEVIARYGGTPPRMVDLADRLHVVPRAVTPLVDALEEADLVRRRVDPANRRSVLLELTEQGTRTRELFREARAEAAASLFAPLSEDQQAQLRELLEKIEVAADQ